MSTISLPDIQKVLNKYKTARARIKNLNLFLSEKSQEGSKYAANGYFSSNKRVADIYQNGKTLYPKIEIGGKERIVK